jgi:subfamily B ATP-binding cassette protein MsbA
MTVFWKYARRMLRYRLALVAALVCAVLSAGGLGAGLLAMGPVLNNILSEARDTAAAAAAGPVRPNTTADISDAGPVQSKAKPAEESKAAGPRNLREIVEGWNQNPWVDHRIPDWVLDELPTDPYHTVIWIMLGLGVLTVLGATASFLHEYLSLTIVQRTVTNIRREAFHRVVRLPLKDVITGGTADSVSRIVNDTSTLGQGFGALLSKAVAQSTKSVAAVVVALVTNLSVTLIALIVAPLLYSVIRKLGKRIRRASRSALESQGGLYGAATESLQGLRVVKVHTTERYEAGRFHRLNKDVMRQMMRVRTARALASPLIETLAIFVLGGLTIPAAHAIIKGRLEPSEFILVFVSLGMAGASLKPLTAIINDIQSSAAAADRIDALLKATPEPGHGSSLPRLGRHKESIEFRSVTFTYPGASRPALADVNLKVAHGERVAVVGPNGSGKTTLLALVPRLFDPDTTAGAVLIDGQDIRGVSVRSLRRQIGVVTQETVLFRGTLRTNIAYGAEGVTADRIFAAARKARADGFIAALPQGYETPVGEQGLTLSGGQRQRIAIARAILRDPAILILDEATSMIDADSEAQIGAAIADFTEGRTCLIVAHRLSTVMGADRIVVMDAGRIVDQGTHAQLLDRCPVYRLIAKNQLLGGGASNGHAEHAAGPAAIPTPPSAAAPPAPQPSPAPVPAPPALPITILPAAAAAKRPG